MKKPELVFVCGCNAAGKSTFIRTRLNELVGFEVIMTDVYKSRTKELIKQAINQHQNIIVETVFNDPSFRDLIDLARNNGYLTTLIALFLDDIQESKNRVAFRGTQQSGITISGSNVQINFNESFKNIATYFFYFDQSDFIYTGVGGVNKLIMSFKKGQLLNYHATALKYPQKFASYSFQKDRLDEDAYNIIIQNLDFVRKS
ncbi:putative ABC-type ATPase [Mucilaginibacter gracilis]|uniref:Putative ABC-type ATPase n=1 Tax=Mucilaginibacter gracilis TaxID=423350 RepID=A0A495J7L1_9SPHI|nr:zeta toxin family protein [Mucilaginibacter gracilis]RKR84975.1 putative ABC-type ATPase [Mucilaginibacter gracilis]